MAKETSLETKTLFNFQQRLKGGGARPNLFEASIVFPTLDAKTTIENQTAIWDDEVQKDFNFNCKAAQLPASNIAEIPVPFRGRILKVAGDRTFEPWTVTIINDESFNLRTAFETWMNTMNDLVTATGNSNPSSYMGTGFVKQLGRGVKPASTGHLSTDNKSSVLRTYKFEGIFPTEVSSIDLSYDSSDTVEEFTVTFQLQNFRVLSTQEAESTAFNIPNITEKSE